MTDSMIRYIDATSPAAEQLVKGFAAPEDHADGAKHRLARRARQSVMVRALARAMLWDETGIPAADWRFELGTHGAPITAVAGAFERFVSFAHSAAMVSCAVAKHGPVGLDVERIRVGRSIKDLARAAFGPAEIRDVEADGLASFYRIWVLREAVAKATGQGFALLVNQTDLVLPAIGGDAGCVQVGSIRWRTGYWTIPEAYMIGYAQRDILEALPAPRLFRFTEPGGNCVAPADRDC